MLLAALAIRGQRSAHSLATGPVMAEPAAHAICSVFNLTGCCRGRGRCSESLNSTPTLHLSLGVHDNACVVLEVDKGALLSPPGLALADHHGWGHCRVQAAWDQAVHHGSTS